MPKTTKILTLTVLLLAIPVFLVLKNRQPIQSDTSEEITPQILKLTADLDPNTLGEETVEITIPDYLSDEEKPTQIKILSQSGNPIVEQQELRFQQPMAELFEIVDLSPTEKAIKAEDVVFTHHFQALFLKIYTDEEGSYLEPIYVKDTEDFAFFNTVGQLTVKDLDGDGYLEIAEIIDEYPPEGGRGHPVLSGIYKYNGEGEFTDLTNNTEEYEKYFDILGGSRTSSELIRLSESRGPKLEGIGDYWNMTKRSAEENEFYPAEP